VLGGMRDFINRSIECVFVGLGRLGESAQFSNELKGRRANFVVRRGRCKIMQGLDVSAHDGPSTINSQPSTTFAMQTFFGSVKKPAFAKPPSRRFGVPGATARQAQRFAQLISLYKHSLPP
jgi:hypothetical protein